MSKVGSIIVLMFFVGFIGLAIPCFLAPTDTYIQDSLEPTEEPFYITVNPLSTKLSVGDSYLLVARSNLDDVSYTWEQYLDNRWNTLLGNLIDGCYPVRTNYTGTSYYRCAITHGDRIIYSAPCVVTVARPTSYNTLDIKSGSAELDKIEDSDKTVEFENTEVIEEKTESEGE